MQLGTKRWQESVLWNLFLLTVGCFFLVLSINGIVRPHEFIPTGVTGACVLITYLVPSLTPSFLYGVLSIFLFIAGYFVLGRKFLLYSIYGSSLITIFLSKLTYVIPITDPLLSSIAAGVISGLGSGILLYSKGCDGGLTIIGIILFEKWRIKVGSFFLIFNALVFALGTFFLPLDNLLYSMLIAYTMSMTMHMVQTMFNQNKVVFVISPHSEEIASVLMKKFGQGITFLQGEGAFTHQPKKIILTVVPSVLLKKMQLLVLRIDPNAFIVIEDTFDIVGAAFTKKSKYK